MYVRYCGCWRLPAFPTPLLTRCSCPAAGSLVHSCGEAHVTGFLVWPIATYMLMLKPRPLILRMENNLRRHLPAMLHMSGSTSPHFAAQCSPLQEVLVRSNPATVLLIGPLRCASNFGVMSPNKAASCARINCARLAALFELGCSSE